MRPFALAFTLALTALSSTSDAALFERDLLSANDGLLTFDTETNLEWLDVTQTVNRSYNEVVQWLQPGGSLEGFRYATGSEVAALITGAGISPTFGALSDTGEANSVLALIGLLGQTGSPADGFPGPATRGIYGDAGRTNARLFADFIVSSSNGFTRAVTGGADDWYRVPFPDDEANAAMGSFLVRTAPIPEPSSIVLMTLGLLPLLVYLRTQRLRLRGA